jgi:hypothetical protein
MIMCKLLLQILRNDEAMLCGMTCRPEVCVHYTTFGHDAARMRRCKALMRKHEWHLQDLIQPVVGRLIEGKKEKIAEEI